LERLGHVAHDIRDLLDTAVFAFDALRKGNIGINGTTGGVLGRSLTGLREFVDSTLTDVRVDANLQRHVRLSTMPTTEHRFFRPRLPSADESAVAG